MTTGLVDRVRVAAERTIAERLTRETADARVHHFAQHVATQRRFLLSYSLRLTPSMAPEAYEAAQEAARRLECDDEVELYHARERGEGRTARLVLHGGPIGVELMGDCLDVCDRTELVAVIGHEIGHCLAHAAHPEFSRVGAAVDHATAKTRRIYALASELTADRLGLLACRDLDAVLRLEMRGQMGRVPARLRLDTQAYLEQCKNLGEELVARGRVMFGETHPEHYVRGWAAWLFSETDVYRDLTGGGAGSRSLEEVDAVLAKLLGIDPSPPR